MHLRVGRRLFDAGAALGGLIALAPLLAAIAAAVLISDGRPILFRHNRVGRGGVPFPMLKFRTMTAGAHGPDVTAAGDPRITAVGRYLRKFKLDELPQLFNVLAGRMSLVGPRPEGPRFVDPADPLWRTVLEARPGITDLASLVYRNEEELLRAVPDRETYYRRVILPEKLRLNLRYLNIRTWQTDLRLIAQTVYYSVLPGRFDSGRVARGYRVALTPEPEAPLSGHSADVHFRASAPASAPRAFADYSSSAKTTGRT